jgi:hypothetical protein
MHSAHEAVCAKLQLSAGSEDRVTELVGEKIIELGQAGEHDADRLAARVLAEFGIEKRIVVAALDRVPRFRRWCHYNAELKRLDFPDAKWSRYRGASGVDYAHPIAMHEQAALLQKAGIESVRLRFSDGQRRGYGRAQFEGPSAMSRDQVARERSLDWIGAIFQKLSVNIIKSMIVSTKIETVISK